MPSKRTNPAAAARAALIPRANALMAEGLAPPDAWRVVLELVKAGEPVAAAPAPAALSSGEVAGELHRQALGIARERGCPLSEAFRIAGGLPARPSSPPTPQWWADSARIDHEARELERASGRPYGLCFREVTERYALADRQAAAAVTRARQQRAHAGDQVAVRMAELLSGASDHAAVRAALLAAGRELAGAGAR
jgi:hypothetical protein